MSQSKMMRIWICYVWDGMKRSQKFMKSNLQISRIHLVPTRTSLKSWAYFQWSEREIESREGGRENEHEKINSYKRTKHFLLLLWILFVCVRRKILTFSAGSFTVSARRHSLILLLHFCSVSFCFVLFCSVVFFYFLNSVTHFVIVAATPFACRNFFYFDHSVI